MNTLFYGDNLPVLRRYVGDESVDLVYLDPPFNSDQDYNVLFAEQDGSRSAAQIKAFGDTWQWWALGLVNARPSEQKKGADKGIDGRIFFHDVWAAGGGPTKQIILSVKAGHTGVAHVRDLRDVLDREKAPLGVLITMEEPTRPMRQEAASAGFYQSPWSQENHPRLQILTIEELLGGKKMDAPSQRGPQFKAAPAAKRKPRHRQKELGE
ncbi:MAG TPA: restriction endonuclease [Pirellulales bacterium]